MSNILLPMLSFRIFMVSGLTFKSLIYFEFILIYSVRRWSTFIFFAHIFQFSYHHLLNRLSLPHCMFLLFLSNSNWPYRHEFIPGFSILLHWSICLLFHQYHSIVWNTKQNTGTLYWMENCNCIYWALKSSDFSFFLYTVVLPILCLLLLHINFRINLLILAK